jgi:putative transposase
MRYRRARLPGATYFFTAVAHERRPIFASPAAILAVERATTHVRQSHPFEIEAQVLLPDHLHAVWALPPGDSDYSTRWRLIKSHFTRAYLQVHSTTKPDASRAAKGEQAVWQRRFWEHVIRDARDFAAHVDYIHYNPVRHKLVAAPRDWPHSTFADWVARGVYEPDWGSAEIPDFPEYIAGE